MTAPRWHIVFAESFDDRAIARARAVADVTLLDRPTPAQLAAAVRHADALLVRTYTDVTASLLQQAKKLRVIGRGGVGLDRIDLDAARTRGVTVVHTPAASTEAVADLTVGLMLGVLRRIAPSDSLVRASRFDEARAAAVGPELGELTLGIIGLGRIGKAVARRCQRGFGMRVLYNDIVDPGPLDFSADPVDKYSLYASADVVSLHVTLTTVTRGLISAEVLTLFKKSAVLINTARGAVVDSIALAKALDAATIGGAGLDVFDPEPLPAGHPLLRAPNTLFMPHAGARSPSALARMNDVVDDVIRVLKGKAPHYPSGSR